MKKIVSTLFCVGSLLLTNSCIASSFGDEIALNCVNATMPLKVKMMPSEIKAWEQGGISGQASSQKQAYQFYQQSRSSGKCYQIASSKGIIVKVFREQDWLLFNP